MVFVVRRFVRFPKFSVWDGLGNAAGTQLPTIFIAGSFGAAAGGLYSMTTRVLVFPVTLIGAAVGQVFLSDAPLAHRENRLARLVQRLTEIMLGVSLPFIFIAFLFGPDVFALIFGDAWRQSGEFAKWLSPWIILTFVYSPLSSVFSVLKLEQVVMKLQVTLLLLRLIVLGVGVFFDDLLVTVILFGVLNFIYYFFLICKVLSLLNISVQQFMFVKAVQLITLSVIAFLFWASGNLETLYVKFLVLGGAAGLVLFYVKQTFEVVEAESA
jgi:O-antigen/teichoic acid export membrane protein